MLRKLYNVANFKVFDEGGVNWWEKNAKILNQDMAMYEGNIIPFFARLAPNNSTKAREKRYNIDHIHYNIKSTTKTIQYSFDMIILHKFLSIWRSP